MEFGAKFNLTGPLFERDPTKTVRANIRDMLEEVAAEGERVVRANSPVLTGAFQRGVVGRVESMSGKRWALHAVISEQHVYPWGSRRGATIRSGRKAVATSSSAQYRGGKLERRLHMFANANRGLQSSRAAIGANLSKGLE